MTYNPNAANQEIPINDALQKVIQENATLTQAELDNNKLVVLKGELALEAVNDNVIILIDKFKTGYECKECNGAGEIKSDCDCVKADRPGKNRLGGLCSICGGNQVLVKICASCDGKGATILIPEYSKNTPTTGTILSRGPHCVEKHSLVGSKVLFAPHTGSQFPFFKNTPEEMYVVIMREKEILCLIHGILDLSKSFNPDFVNAY